MILDTLHSFVTTQGLRDVDTVPACAVLQGLLVGSSGGICSTRDAHLNFAAKQRKLTPPEGLSQLLFIPASLLTCGTKKFEHGE